MAKIIYEGDEYEVNDGDSIQDVCEEAGLPFGCTTGICGTCMLEVEEGMENLTLLTQEEKDMELDPNVRLACQCKIKQGTIKIKF